MPDPAVAPPELSVPLLVLGITLACFGWVLYWGGITVLGALVGAGAGGVLGGFVAFLAGWTNPAFPVAVGVGAAAGAVLGALIIQFFHALVFFLSGVVIGSLGAQLVVVLAHQEDWAWIADPLFEILIRSLGALIGGVALVKLSRFIVVVFTSTLGTALIVLSWPTPLLVAAAGPIWFVSILIQYAVARKLNLFAHTRRKPDAA